MSEPEVIGRKDDGADGRSAPKDRWDLLPTRPLRSIVRVLTFGAGKYGPRNYVKVEDGRRRYYAAALRHMTAWFEGEKVDPDTGESHLAHVAACVLILMDRELEEAIK